MLNIAQGRLVNAFIPVHRGGFKYEVGRVLLWMFSSHDQHNPFLPSYQKLGPSCSVPLLYMFIFHQKSESFRFEYSPHTKGRFSLQEAQRYSFRFTATTEIIDSRTFPLLRGHSVNSNFLNYVIDERFGEILIRFGVARKISVWFFGDERCTSGWIKHMPPL